MQKRANAIRGLVESNENPIVSIHDHGAGGHLNCRQNWWKIQEV
jgi:phosphoribosylformylglycinamidine synthase